MACLFFFNKLRKTFGYYQIQLELAPPKQANEKEDENEVTEQQTEEKEIEYQPLQRVYTSYRL